MRILIVEDEATSQEILSAYLAPYGTVELVEDGAAGIAAIGKAYDEKKPFNLVCLDILMPKVDGHGVLDALRAREKGEGVLLGEGSKVVMVTSRSDSKNVLGSFSEQCDGYVVKPIERAKFLKELVRIGAIKGA